MFVTSSHISRSGEILQGIFSCELVGDREKLDLKFLVEFRFVVEGKFLLIRIELEQAVNNSRKANWGFYFHQFTPLWKFESASFDIKIFTRNCKKFQEKKTTILKEASGREKSITLRSTSQAHATTLYCLAYQNVHEKVQTSVKDA